MPKQKLRQTILARRRLLAASEVRATSLLIQKAEGIGPANAGALLKAPASRAEYERLAREFALERR